MKRLLCLYVILACSLASSLPSAGQLEAFDPIRPAAPASELWSEADRYANGWSSLPWFGYFVELEQGWIYHLEHGYQYYPGSHLNSFVFYDLNMESWFWSGSALYPYLSKLGRNAGWYWYYKGGTLGNRWFNRLKDAQDLQEGAINQGSGPGASDMVRVEGGTLSTSGGLDGTLVGPLHVGKYEVTWAEWLDVRDWAVGRGYDIAGNGEGCGHDHPVRSVNWFDVLKWCNARSEREGMTPVYTSGGSVFKTGQPDHTAISVNASANGYRLPREAEWEFVARGGNLTNGYRFAGSTSMDDVGWYWDNSVDADCALSVGRGTWPVGLKAANELGLYDMCGNVFEWCWDHNSSKCVVRGGSWYNEAYFCSVTYQVSFAPEKRYFDTGFRVFRSAQ